MSQCTTEECKNQTSGAARAEQSCECPCGEFVNNTCSPAEKAIQFWTKVTPDAMRGVMTDILKEKMKKAWGPMMEKEADAYIKHLGEFWESMLARGKARKDLSADFAKIFESYGK